MKNHPIAVLCTSCATAAALLALAAYATPAHALVPRRDEAKVKPAVALPDLASASRVRVAGKYPVAWGGSLTIADADARAAQGGICQVAFEHEIRNSGAAPAAAFSRRWNNQGVAGAPMASVASLAAGASVRRVDTLPLKPGVNQLVMGLDNQGAVQEQNEDNNIYTLTVVLNGSCNGPSAGATVEAAGLGGSRFGPKHQAQRQQQPLAVQVPAVQVQPGPPNTQVNPGPPTTQLQPRTR